MTDSERAYFNLTQRVSGLELEIAALKKRLDDLKDGSKASDKSEDNGVWYDPK